MSPEFWVAVRETGSAAAAFAVFAVLMYRLIGGWRVFASTYKDAASDAQIRADKLQAQVDSMVAEMTELKIEMARLEVSAATRENILRDEIRVLKEALNGKV